MKFCSQCSCYLDFECFVWDKTAGRWSSSCLECRAAIARAWYRKNKARALARMETYRQKPVDARRPNRRSVPPVDGKYLCLTCKKRKEHVEFEHPKLHRQPTRCKACIAEQKRIRYHTDPVARRKMLDSCMAYERRKRAERLAAAANRVVDPENN